KLPEELIFHTPVNFSVFLPECTPAQAPELAEISFRAGHAAVAGKSLYNVEGILSGNRRRIHLLRLDADFDDQGLHTVHGGAVLDLENRLISCHVSGTADLLSITEELGGNANLKQLADNFRSTSFSFQLHPSPPELARLNLEGKIYQPEAKFAVFSMKNIEADFTLRDGIITFRKVTANLASDHYSRLTATASAPVEVFSGNAEIPFEMQLEMPDTPGRPRNPYAMTANATMTVSHQQGTLAVNSVSGHLFPEIVANLAKMHELRHLSEIPKYISCRGHEPILYRGEIPAVSMNSLADMEVRLSCTLQDADLIKVPLKRGSCRTIITRHGLKFLDIDVETIQGDTGGLDIDIVFSPFSIRLTQLHLKGNPANITAFIGPLNSQELYRRIWEHCTWSQEIQPEIFIPAIVYESEEATDNGDWKLTLEGTFQAKDSYYRNCYIPEVSCRLNLELPGSGLLIDNIKAGYPGDAPLLASIALNFEDDLKGVVTIDSPPGRLNLIGMLKAAAPVLAENVSHFNLHPQTTIRCRGTFTAADKTTFRLQGTIESQEFTYRRITLNQLRGTWDLDNSRITWEVPNAGFYGGTLTSQGKYDFSQRKADMEITTSCIPLREIADAAERYRNFKSADEEPEAGTPSDIKGALDSSARLVIHSPRENQPLMLEGDGHVNITAPDLWGIPLFMPLAKLISISTLKLISRDAISSLGQISTLDTDFSLHGRDISFQNLKTDGTILALEGSGKYNIDRKEADFDI
ncbi:MAG: hypothetical protein J6S21_05595, partial [Victivallales bacterium]|nr:hypothetical protein [Victivallales bacterium]